MANTFPLLSGFEESLTTGNQTLSIGRTQWKDTFCGRLAFFFTPSPCARFFNLPKPGDVPPVCELGHEPLGLTFSPEVKMQPLEHLHSGFCPNPFSTYFFHSMLQ